MVTDYYDIGIVGTSLYSQNIINKELKTIFLEPSNNYGTTYNSINELSSSTYLKSFKIVKERKKGKLIIESMPIFINSDNKIIERYKKKPYSGNLEYIKITDLYFLENNGSIIKLWTNKNDIINTDFMNNFDRFHFMSGIKNSNLSNFKNYIIENNHSNLLFKIFIKYEIFDNHIIKYFENPIFLYPIHGITSLCENISLKNSINGATYLLSKNIIISDNLNNNNFKYMVSCEYGNIYLKNIIYTNFLDKNSYVKVLWLKNWKLKNNFLIFLEGHLEIIKIYGLNSEAKVCEEGTQLIYIVKKTGFLENSEFDLLKINDDDILLELDFITKYDIIQP